MTAGGGAAFGPVAGAAFFAPLRATSETATAMTVISARIARTEGMRPKLICLGAAWVEADIFVPPGEWVRDAGRSGRRPGGQGRLGSRVVTGLGGRRCGRRRCRCSPGRPGPRGP